MSRSRTRARNRRALLEKVCAEFEQKRNDPEAFACLLVRLAASDLCVWAIAQSAARDKPLSVAERAIIAQLVAPHLAGNTSGLVLRRHMKGQTMIVEQELLIRCSECGVDTTVPALCFVCLSPLALRTGTGGEPLLVCPHDGGTAHSKGYGPTTRDLVPGFGAAVRVRRESLGLSATKLARLAGTHQTTVSKIEKETRAPSLFLAVKLASGLSVTLNVLLQEAASFTHSCSSKSGEFDEADAA
jgi:DNA-binding XRE family transcriptional regulator